MRHGEANESNVGETDASMGSSRERLVFDIRGQICPSSLLVALRELNAHQVKLREGLLEIVFMTDNRQATATIPDSARNMGYGASVLKEEGHYVISITALQ